MLIFKLLLFFTCLASCKPESASSGTPTPRIKIMYIGNSLTYSNDLPNLIKELAKQEGIKISSKSITLPNYSFEDHLREGNIQSEISNGQYDFIVGQQGPSALPESQEILMRDTRILAELCSKSPKTKLALYMVWPSSERLFDLDNVIHSYSNAAKQTASMLCPAGLAWKKAWETNPNLPLYSADGFHPSLMGSVLAALTIYGVLNNKDNFDFIQYETCSWKKEVSKSDFELLKRVALKAME
jgi:hypothetical protein